MASYYWVEFTLTEPPVKAAEIHGDAYLVREQYIRIEVFRDPDNNKLYGFVVDSN